MLKLSEKGSGQTGAKILLDAMSNDKVHLARFILDALDGKIIDSTSEGASTPLISSVLLPDSRARSKFMDLLLQRGASVNRQDEQGRTALSYACENGYLDAVKVLVQNNADPELVDIWGNTALMYASVAGHSSVVDFLVRAFKRLGLQIDRQNKVGNSAVEVAKYLGHQDCLFALTSKAKKSHENHVSTPGDVESSADKDKLGRKSTEALKVNVLQSQSHIYSKDGGPGRMGEVAGTSDRRKSSFLRSRIHSMDSIEEFERECDGAPPSKDVLPGASALKPHARSFHVQHGICKNRLGDRITSDCSNIAPLSRCPDNQFPLLFSPRPVKNTSNRRSSACTGASSDTHLSSPLGILLTPILRSKDGNQETENEIQKKTAFDFGIRRFDDSYYQKRCSLPTSVLSPTPPDRSLMPLRKSKTVLKNIPLGSTDTPSTSMLGAQSTFTVLGNKLLRRFTFPELKKTVVEACVDEAAATLSGSHAVAARGMPKSETFPLVKRHPQVGSKPSIDSISAVKCEFDCQLKMSAS